MQKPGKQPSQLYKETLNSKYSPNYKNLYSTDERNCFIEEAEYLSTKTPSAIYEPVKFDVIRSRSLITRFLKTDKEKEQAKHPLHKVHKKDGPAPGTYNIENSFEKTQWITKKPPVDK